jgi:hypothetical protein
MAVKSHAVITILQFSSPSTMQQYQDLKLNPFNIRHCTSCFGLLGHHQVR